MKTISYIGVQMLLHKASRNRFHFLSSNKSRMFPFPVSCLAVFLHFIKGSYAYKVSKYSFLIILLLSDFFSIKKKCIFYIVWVVDGFFYCALLLHDFFWFQEKVLFCCFSSGKNGKRILIYFRCSSYLAHIMKLQESMIQ